MFKDQAKARAYYAKWRRENRDRMAAHTRNWRLKNKERSRALDKAWRAANPDKVRLYKKRWESKNPEKVAAHKKTDRQRNAAKILLRNRRYRLERPEVHRNAMKKHRAKNPAKTLAAGRIYRANRRGAEYAGPGLSINLAARLLIAQNNVCAYCPADLLITGYHLDHVKPLSKGGRHEDANIALSCPPCNLSKHAKDPEEFRLYRCAKA